MCTSINTSGKINGKGMEAADWFQDDFAFPNLHLNWIGYKITSSTIRCEPQLWVWNHTYTKLSKDGRYFYLNWDMWILFEKKTSFVVVINDNFSLQIWWLEFKFLNTTMEFSIAPRGTSPEKKKPSMHANHICMKRQENTSKDWLSTTKASAKNIWVVQSSAFCAIPINLRLKIDPL